MLELAQLREAFPAQSKTDLQSTQLAERSLDAIIVEKDGRWCLLLVHNGSNPVG